MNARQNTGADFDGANSTGVATVDTGFASQDLAAHDLGFDFEQQAFNLDFVKGNAFSLQQALTAAWLPGQAFEYEPACSSGSGRQQQNLPARLLTLAMKGFILAGGFQCHSALPASPASRGSAGWRMMALLDDRTPHRPACLPTVGRPRTQPSARGFGAGDDQVHLGLAPTRQMLGFSFSIRR